MPYLHGASHPSCADLWTRFLQHMYSGAQACARPTLYRSHISPVFFCRAGTYACLQAASCDRAAFLAAGCSDVLTHCRGGSFARVRLWLRLPVEFVHAGGCVVRRHAQAAGGAAVGDACPLCRGKIKSEAEMWTLTGQEDDAASDEAYLTSLAQQLVAHLNAMPRARVAARAPANTLPHVGPDRRLSAGAAAALASRLPPPRQPTPSAPAFVDSGGRPAVEDGGATTLSQAEAEAAPPSYGAYMRMARLHRSPHESLQGAPHDSMRGASGMAQRPLSDPARQQASAVSAEGRRRAPRPSSDRSRRLSGGSAGASGPRSSRSRSSGGGRGTRFAVAYRAHENVWAPSGRG